jgi:pimeloyl-ACP methyl ester carboxylesterase
MRGKRTVADQLRIAAHAVALLVLTCMSMFGEQPEGGRRAYAQGRGPRGVVVGTRPCPSSSAFTCLALSVPRDHAALTDADAIQVVFARLPARNPQRRRGVLVTIVGGPGASGIVNADAYASAYPAALRDVFDLVFFDIRGVGLSGNLRCDDAVTAFLSGEARAATAQEESATIDAARAFAAACMTRLGDASALRHFSTAQAVGDLEAFREAIGEARLWLYGESYGTQFAQAYAARYPDRVAGMVLDSPVDPAVDGPAFAALQVSAFNDTLLRTLSGCDAQPACRADFGGSALDAYDRLAARLRAGPLPFTFRGASDSALPRALTLGGLENAAATYLYTPEDRALFVRALAYAARGQPQPLAMLSYIAAGQDPQTLATDPDPTYSDAAYYTINCNDYAFFSGSQEERARRYMRAGDSVDSRHARMNSVFYGELPCAFWPRASGDAAPVTIARDVPALILASDADPATPYAQSRELARRYRNGAAIVQSGGAHVLFARGAACIDEPVVRFLTDDALPAQAQSHCDGALMTPHVPLLKPALTDYATLIELFAAIDGELKTAPGYVAWSRAIPHADACPLGGTFTVDYDPAANADRYTLRNCVMTSGVALSGSAQRPLGADRFAMKISLTGAMRATLDYTRDGAAAQLSGTVNGKKLKVASRK